MDLVVVVVFSGGFSVSLGGGDLQVKTIEVTQLI
jgi:hypothetical protein